MTWRTLKGSSTDGEWSSCLCSSEDEDLLQNKKKNVVNLTFYFVAATLLPTHKLQCQVCDSSGSVNHFYDQRDIINAIETATKSACVQSLPMHS